MRDRELVSRQEGGRSDHQEWLFGFGSTHGLNTSGLSYITCRDITHPIYVLDRSRVLMVTILRSRAGLDMDDFTFL